MVRSDCLSTVDEKKWFWQFVLHVALMSAVVAALLWLPMPILAQGRISAPTRPVRILVGALVFGDTSLGREIAAATDSELSLRHPASQLSIVSVKEFLNRVRPDSPDALRNSDDLLAAVRIFGVDIVIEVNARRGPVGDIMAQPIMISADGAIDTLPLLAAPDVEAAATGVALRVWRILGATRILKR